MAENEPIHLDLKSFSERLVQYRKAADKTQEQASEFLGMSRPTYFAMEKGLRAPSSEELIQLAEFLNRPLHELVRPGIPVKLEPHLRAGVDANSADAEELKASIQNLERYAEDYRELEEKLGTHLATNYPPEVKLPQRGNLDVYKRQEVGWIADFPSDPCFRPARSRIHLLFRKPPLPNR